MSVNKFTKSKILSGDQLKVHDAKYFHGRNNFCAGRELKFLRISNSRKINLVRKFYKFQFFRRLSSGNEIEFLQNFRVCRILIFQRTLRGRKFTSEKVCERQRFSLTKVCAAGKRFVVGKIRSVKYFHGRKFVNVKNYWKDLLFQTSATCSRKLPKTSKTLCPQTFLQHAKFSPRWRSFEIFASITFLRSAKTQTCPQKSRRRFLREIWKIIWMQTIIHQTIWISSVEINKLWPPPLKLLSSPTVWVPTFELFQLFNFSISSEQT